MEMNDDAQAPAPPPTAVVGRRGTAGGAAGSGGYSFQSRVIAYVAVHILAERRLDWLSLVRDVPVVLEAETGRSGDDLRVILRDSEVVIEGQAKKGLIGFAKLRDALAGFARDLPSAPREQGMLLVDPGSAAPIRGRLAADLKRIAQGRRDGLGDLANRSIAWLQEQGCPEVVERLGLITLAVEDRSAPDRRLAIEMLLPLFGDRDTAEHVWDTLVAASLELCANRGRFTREQLLALLKRNGYDAAVDGSSGRTLGERLDEVLALQRQSVAIQSSAGPGSGLGEARMGPDALWHARIDAARDVINRGLPTSALTLLEGIERQLLAGATPDLPQPKAPGSIRRRIESNRAGALLRIGRFADGCAAALRSLSYDEDAATYVVAARAHLLANQKSEAVHFARKALELNSEMPGAWSLLVETGEVALESFDATRETVPPALRADVGVRTAAAVEALNREDFAYAQSTLTQIEAEGDADPERLLLQAQAIIGSRGDSVVRGGLSPEESARVEEIASKALSQWVTGEYSGTYEELLLLRASVRRMVGRRVDALSDAERAFRFAPLDGREYWRAAYLYGSLLHESGRAQEAETVLASLGAQGVESMPAPVYVLRARVLSTLGRLSEVLPQLTGALEKSAHENAVDTKPESDPARVVSERDRTRDLARRSRVDVALVVLECALEDHLLDFAEDVLWAVSREESGWIADLYEARLAAARDMVSESNAAFERAADGAQHDRDSDTVRKVRFEYAGALARRREFASAAQQFKLGRAWEYGGTPRRGLMGALLESGDAAEAHELLLSLDATSAQEPWVFLASARVADARNDVAGVTQHLRAYHAIRPEEHGVTLRLTEALVRSGEVVEAQEILDGLVRLEDLDARDRMNAAMLLSRLDRHEQAVWEGLRAYRADRESPEVASAFVGLFTRFEQAGGRPDASVVGPETHVTLRPTRLGAEVSYCVYGDAPVDASRFEILASDHRYADLMGKHLGEDVILWPGLPTEATYRVVEIKSALVHAFQDILTHFQERFPDNGAIQRFTMDDALSPEALQPIIAVVHRQQQSGERLLALYDSHDLPLGALAGALGRSQPDLCHTLISRKSGSLHVEFAENDLREASLSAAGDGSPLVLTRSALLTLQSIESAGVPIMTALSKTGRRLIVARALVDDLEEEERDAAQWRGKSRAVLAAAPSGFAIHEVGVAEVASAHDRSVSLLVWVREHAAIEVRPASAVVPAAVEWRARIGKSSADALELCGSEAATLLADDRGLRRVGLERVARFSSCSTWALIHALQATQHLSPEQARRAVRHVIALRHDFITVDVGLLIGSLRDSAFQFTADTSAVFDRLAGKEVAVESAAVVSALLLRELATDAIGFGALGAAAQICAERMTRANDVRVAVNLLTLAADRALRFLPHAHDIVMRSLSVFAESASQVTGLVGGRRGGSTA